MKRTNNKKIDLLFFKNLVVRQIRQDYLENLTGFAWLVLQPLIMLAVYAFVFGTIFKARIPEAADIGFVPYLAVAFWPWTAFSEAILRANGSITANGALIGKVSFATEAIPLATVTGTFFMHLIGYLAVLIVLQIMGTGIYWLHLLVVIPFILIMWALACAIALFSSSIQVFVRDVAQILPPLMTFWFFTTPILYAASFLPASVASLARWNPMAWLVSRLRELLLFGEFNIGYIDLVFVVLILLFAWLSLLFFRRFSGHFEDFL